MVRKIAKAAPAVVQPAEDTTTKTVVTTKNFIRSWRLFRGYERQADLCKVCKISRPVLSRLENGTLPYRQPQLEVLAATLKCAPGDLINVDPSGAGDIFRIYEQIPEAKRERAIKLLRNLLR